MVWEARRSREGGFEVLEDRFSRALPTNAVDQVEKLADDAGGDGARTVEPPLVIEHKHGRLIPSFRLFDIPFEQSLLDHQHNGAIERRTLVLRDNMIGVPLFKIQV